MYAEGANGASVEWTVTVRRALTHKQLKQAWAGILPLTCLLLSGCQNFFQCAKSSCTNTSATTTTNTNDVVFLSNSSAGSSYVASYGISSTGFTSAGSALNVGFVPAAMAVSYNNKFLYVASPVGGIYLYNIGSTGVLTAPTTPLQQTVGTGGVSSMVLSPDGAWLFAMDRTGGVLSQFALNSSTGALGSASTVGTPAPASACITAGPPATPASQSCTVSISPVSGGAGVVAVALSDSGTAVFPYSTAAGITSASYRLIAPPSNAVDSSIAFDSRAFLYIASTNALSSFASVGSTPTDVQDVTYSAGVTPRGVTVFGSYLYTANKGNGSISAFSFDTSGKLTVITGSPFTSVAGVSTMGVDNSSTYLVAAGYDATAGMRLYKASSGVLSSYISGVGTGTDTTVPTLVALTH